MKRFFAILLSFLFISSVSFADNLESQIYADTMIKMMEEKDLEVEDLLRIKEATENLINLKQQTNQSDPNYWGIWKGKYFVDSFREPTNATDFFTIVLNGMFPKARLLDIIRNFIVFQDIGGKTVKILAGYHQYFAVKKAVESTRQAMQFAFHSRLDSFRCVE